MTEIATCLFITNYRHIFKSITSLFIILLLKVYKNVIELKVISIYF